MIECYKTWRIQIRTRQVKETYMLAWGSLTWADTRNHAPSAVPCSTRQSDSIIMSKYMIEYWREAECFMPFIGIQI